MHGAKGGPFERALGSGLVVAGLLLALLGCDGEPSESQAPEGFDCAVCTLDEMCWEAEDYDGSLVGGCMDLPSDCRDDPSCDCINASSEDFCGSVGGIANGNPCRVVEDRPLVHCVITLG